MSRLVVWKFELPLGSVAAASMPKGARLVHVGPDPLGVPCVWAEVDPDAPTVRRLLGVIGTGHDVPMKAGRAVHVGSFVGGSFVWHLYDLGET